MLQSEPVQLSGQDVTPLGDVLLALLPAEPLAYLLARPRGNHIVEIRVQPIPAGAALLGGDDFDLLAGMELIVEGHQPSIHLGATATIADLAVDLKGKVHRRSPQGQFDDVASGRKHIDPLREYVALERVHKLAGILHIILPVSGLAQPIYALLKAVIVLNTFLVSPVSGNAVFGDAVHRFCAYLELKRSPFQRDHRRVQGLVQVPFGHGDVVVHRAWNGSPETVDQSQNVVAVSHLLYDDPYTMHVVDLVKGKRPLQHG